MILIGNSSIVIVKKLEATDENRHTADVVVVVVSLPIRVFPSPSFSQTPSAPGDRSSGFDPRALDPHLGCFSAVADMMDEREKEQGKLLKMSTLDGDLPRHSRRRQTVF